MDKQELKKCEVQGSSCCTVTWLGR